MCLALPAEGRVLLQTPGSSVPLCGVREGEREGGEGEGERGGEGGRGGWTIMLMTGVCVWEN